MNTVIANFKIPLSLIISYLTRKYRCPSAYNKDTVQLIRLYHTSVSILTPTRSQFISPLLLANEKEVAIFNLNSLSYWHLECTILSHRPTIKAYKIINKKVKLLGISLAPAEASLFGYNDSEVVVLKKNEPRLFSKKSSKKFEWIASFKTKKSESIPSVCFKKRRLFTVKDSLFIASAFYTKADAILVKTTEGILWGKGDHLRWGQLGLGDNETTSIKQLTVLFNKKKVDHVWPNETYTLLTTPNNTFHVSGTDTEAFSPHPMMLTVAYYDHNTRLHHFGFDKKTSNNFMRNSGRSYLRFVKFVQVKTFPKINSNERIETLFDLVSSLLVTVIRTTATYKERLFYIAGFNPYDKTSGTFRKLSVSTRFKNAAIVIRKLFSFDKNTFAVLSYDLNSYINTLSAFCDDDKAMQVRLDNCCKAQKKKGEQLLDYDVDAGLLLFDNRCNNDIRVVGL